MSPVSNDSVRVLVVDDDDGLRKMLRRSMEQAGYDCVAVPNASEALELVDQQPVTVVITDILMPGMDGLQLTEQIRELSDADVIVLTGLSGQYTYEEAVGRGASDFIFKPFRYEELILRIERIVRERKMRQERDNLLQDLQRLAVTDSLTQLFNARHFHHQLELEVDRSNRYCHPLSLLLMDIDNFKKFNDRFGHLSGNDVLVRLGRIITFCLRKMDTAYRYGGEEFTVLLPETHEGEALQVAERIRASIAENRFSPTPGVEVGVTVSVGVTQYCPSEELDTFIRRADDAMYLTKRQGRNRVQLLAFKNLA